MQLLLDTHIWIWGLTTPDRLPDRVRDALAARENEIWLSPISVWEAMQLFERGRIAADESAARAVERMLRTMPAREAPFTHEVAMASCLLDLPHHDPVDRLLAATARVHGLTLVTADERLLGSREYETMDGRGDVLISD